MTCLLYHFLSFYINFWTLGSVVFIYIFYRLNLRTTCQLMEKYKICCDAYLHSVSVIAVSLVCFCFDGIVTFCVLLFSAAKRKVYGTVARTGWHWGELQFISRVTSVRDSDWAAFHTCSVLCVRGLTVDLCYLTGCLLLLRFVDDFVACYCSAAFSVDVGKLCFVNFCSFVSLSL